jgi:hypothetical protein
VVIVKTTVKWEDVFTRAYSEYGYELEEIAAIYRIEMDARAFFDYGGIVPDCLKLQGIEKDAKEIRYYWNSCSTQAACPYCGHMSKVPANEYYTKPIQDIPRDNLAFYHIVRFQKFRCENSECSKNLFNERFPEFSEEDSRKTVRFKRYCAERSLGCGCNAAQRSLREEGAVISNDTIARYLKVEAAKAIETNITRDNVKIISIDDINRRKGNKSTGCTVFLDGETHKVLIIVNGTTKEAAMRVLQRFPSSEFLSRDRASAYSSAGEECGKTQVADRFHLIQNAQQAVKDALSEILPAKMYIREGDGWATTEPGGEEKEAPSFYVSDHVVEERIKAAGLTPAKAQKYRDTLKMLELDSKGMRTASIAQAMNMSIKDVRALRATAVTTLQRVDDKIASKSGAQDTEWIKTVSGEQARPSMKSIVEPYREAVVELWNSGKSHRDIYPVIQSLGYTGSSNAIYQFILKLRTEAPDEIRPSQSRTVKKT